MKQTAFEAYKEIRPELRAVLALVIWLRFGSDPRVYSPESCFTMADLFLTLYEQRRTS